MREISTEESLNLLKQQPIFSLWPNDLLMQFVQQLQLVFFNQQETVVTEGDIIDKVYIIVSGKAEVSQVEAYDHTKQFIVAALHTGDSIGLRATGLFSETGVRTATVTALTPLILIKIEVEILNRFLLQNPHLNNALATATEQTLKLALIKKAAPFSVLTNNEIQSLENKIDIVEFPQDTIIFTEGDKGDYCYIIQQGQVEITKNENPDPPEILAILSSPSVFGEVALVMDLPRTATARTVTDVRLLRLLREELHELLERQHTSKQAFALMILERSRPKKLPSISEHQQINDDGESIIILKNAQNHEYYQLLPEGWLIWQMIDGKRSTKDIVMTLVMKHHIFSPAMVNNLIIDLTRTGFVELQGFKLNQNNNLPIWMKCIDKIKNIMEYEWSFPSVDQWLTKVYQNKIKAFYTVPAQLIMLMIAVIGVISFAFFSPKAVHLIPHTSHLILLLILVDIAGLISLPLHELAHAFTTKYYHREVSHFGVGWYWIGPMAFTDTSDMWLSSKWPRVLVNIAGVWIDFVLAGIMAIVAIIMPWHTLALFFWLFSIFIYFNIYHNLYPLIELDGYYILMDIFDQPHLREDAVEWLIEKLPNMFKEPVFTREYKHEIIYWLISIVFIILSPLIAWFVQHFILAAVFPGLNQGYWQLLFPFIAITLSLVSVWVEIQKQRRSS